MEASSSSSSSSSTNLFPIYLGYRQSILSLKPNETFIILIKGRDEFETIVTYLSDLFKPKNDRKRNHYICSLNETFFKRARVRESSPSPPSSPKQKNKISHLNSDNLCEGKLQLSADHTMVVISAHSSHCSRQFTRFPQVLTQHIDHLLTVHLKTCHPRPARSIIADQIRSSEFHRLIPSSPSSLAQHLRNRCRKISESILIEPPAPSENQPQLQEPREFIYEPMLLRLQTIIAQGFVVILMLDQIQTASGTKLLSLLFRSPDSLCFLILAQAIADKDDLGSKRRFLNWVKSKVPSLDDPNLQRVIFIRNLKDDLDLVTTIFPNCHPCLQMVDVLHQLTKRLSPSLHQIARKCIRTKSKTKFETWSKETVKVASPWFQEIIVEGYRSSCLWHRLNLDDAAIRMAASQDILTTDRSETFHIFLKGQEIKQIMRSLSDEDITSWSDSWNRRHDATLRRIYVPAPMRLLSLVFEQTPPIFHSVINEIYQSYATPSMRSSHVTTKYGKMFSHLRDCLTHECKTLRSLGIICKHFLFLIKRDNTHLPMTDSTRQALFLDVKTSPLHQRITSYRDNLLKTVAMTALETRYSASHHLSGESGSFLA